MYQLNNYVVISFVNTQKKTVKNLVLYLTTKPKMQN